MPSSSVTRRWTEESPCTNFIQACGLDVGPKWPSVWASCLRDIRSWCVPPNWSAADWFEELQAQSATAVVLAMQDYDPDRGVPLAAFVRRRILTAARTRSRQEWAYAQHCPSETCDDTSGDVADDAHPIDPDEEAIQAALSRLAEADRRLITHLFWDGWTEAAVAEALGISQPAVSKRKQAVLQGLRRLIGDSEK